MRFVLPVSWHRSFYPRRGGAPLAVEPSGDAMPPLGDAARAAAELAAGVTDAAEVRRVLAPVRTALAGAPERAYAEAADALRQVRTGSWAHRLAAAFLAPDLAGPDFAEVPERHPLAPLLLASASTVEQAQGVLARLAPTQAEQLREPELLHTLAEGIGDGVLDLYARYWTGRSVEYTLAGVPDYLAAMIEALPAIGTGRAFETLLGLAGQRGVPAAIMAAADRFPDLVVPLLRANASRPRVAELLSRHLARHTGTAVVATGAVPRLPQWVEPATLPPIRVAAAPVVQRLMRGEIPPEAGDLARFGWELCCRWEEAGAPPAGRWALEAQALVGDDETAAGLAEAVRRWAGEGAGQRVAAGIDVLRRLGGDAALRQLHDLATTAKSRAVRARAEAGLAGVAAGLGLTADALADRLVPRFGLAPGATVVLGDGPHRITAGFDDQLRPWVTDEHGTRRRDRPGSPFAAIRQGVRKVTAEQVHRLELAMTAGRRWSAAEFRVLLEHPLLFPLARRLVWITGPPGAPGVAVRVAEDRTLAGVADERADLAAGDVLGVAHPADLDVPAWMAVFADYGILQPFPQLHRPVYRLEPGESAAARLRPVAVVRLLALERHGWRRAAVEGARVLGMERDLPGGDVVAVGLDPGIALGPRPDRQPEQRLCDIRIRTPEGRARPLAELDAASVSQLLADLAPGQETSL
ncbi:DUF4132 domain-containing protein [Dactylosporangium sp. NPDC000244]|uniref:DUF4132 domain-containing protein n=1 Tax=Dactylosporangium sp. NPDC000244 TaxID=3154365 RepID=UPI0033340C62